MNLSELFIGAGQDDTRDGGHLISAYMAVPAVTRVGMPNRGSPGHQVAAAAAGGLYRDHGVLRGDAPRAAFSHRGIDNMSSTSSKGSTPITLQFNLSRNLDGAALDVQSAISAAGASGPSNIAAPSSYGKVNPRDQPGPVLTLTSKILPAPARRLRRGGGMMAQRIPQRLRRSRRFQVYGPQSSAVRVQPTRASAGRGGRA